MLALGLAMTALGCVLVAALCDVASFEIPDALSVAIIVLYVGYALVTVLAGLATVSWASQLGGMAVMFMAGLALFSRGWMGGGDIKLLTAIALWTGLLGLPRLLIGTSVAGGVLALSVLALRALPALVSKTPGPGLRVLQKGEPLPYGVAIAAGVVYWLIDQPMPAF